ncbi:hypothetical protein L227DRAFT_46382 [Lentinus tigrinus ALCF2SS1-6]|uniref:Uncharacterized protein n=1 Tax=Lentinus tigrinus ALCF2SS1-6 TaxID=1328759 RepID=A0A5C2SKL3_9APHY|nr:hypothetical protein L227DRAFT_46382 [Lentinus tigrinus ALCF2SS1-6]
MPASLPVSLLVPILPPACGLLGLLSCMMLYLHLYAIAQSLALNEQTDAHPWSMPSSGSAYHLADYLASSRTRS